MPELYSEKLQQLQGELRAREVKKAWVTDFDGTIIKMDKDLGVFNYGLGNVLLKAGMLNEHADAYEMVKGRLRLKEGVQAPLSIKEPYEPLPDELSIDEFFTLVETQWLTKQFTPEMQAALAEYGINVSDTDIELFSPGGGRVLTGELIRLLGEKAAAYYMANDLVYEDALQLMAKAQHDGVKLVISTLSPDPFVEGLMSGIVDIYNQSADRPLDMADIAVFGKPYHVGADGQIYISESAAKGELAQALDNAYVPRDWDLSGALYDADGKAMAADRSEWNYKERVMQAIADSGASIVMASGDSPYSSDGPLTGAGESYGPGMFIGESTYAYKKELSALLGAIGNVYEALGLSGEDMKWLESVVHDEMNRATERMWAKTTQIMNLTGLGVDEYLQVSDQIELAYKAQLADQLNELHTSLIDSLGTEKGARLRSYVAERMEGEGSVTEVAHNFLLAVLSAEDISMDHAFMQQQVVGV